MKLSEVEVPTGNKDLRVFVDTKDEKELRLVVRKELKGERRRYVLTRLVQRINKLAAAGYTNKVMSQLEAAENK